MWKKLLNAGSYTKSKMEDMLHVRILITKYMPYLKYIYIIKELMYIFQN